MAFALYLLDAEQNVDKDKIIAPAGFIYSLLNSSVSNIPDGSGGMIVPNWIDYFTHKIINGQIIDYTADEIAKYFPPEKKWAQYGLSTEPAGFIHGLTSNQITRPIDLAKLEKSGAKQIQVDTNVDHWTHKIDDTGKVVEYSDDEKLQLQPPTLSIFEHIFISLATGSPIDLSMVDPKIINKINTAISFNKLVIPILSPAIKTEG